MKLMQHNPKAVQWSVCSEYWQLINQKKYSICAVHVATLWFHSWLHLLHHIQQLIGLSPLNVQKHYTFIPMLREYCPPIKNKRDKEKPKCVWVCCSRSFVPLTGLHHPSFTSEHVTEGLTSSYLWATSQCTSEPLCELMYSYVCDSRSPDCCHKGCAIRIIPVSLLIRLKKVHIMIMAITVTLSSRAWLRHKEQNCLIVEELIPRSL